MVAGYYTLSMATVMADAVRHALPGRLPQYPLPVALIGRLAGIYGREAIDSGSGCCRTLWAARSTQPIRWVAPE